VANWDDQGKQYASFVEQQLKAEHDRRDSVNTRAGTALTGSAGLVTLVLAVFAVLIGKDFVLSGLARYSLGFALLMLLFAAASAVIAGYPWKSKIVSPGTLEGFLAKRWKNTETRARNVTSMANVEAIRTLRKGTSIKFTFLMSAAVLPVLAVFGLVICTMAVLGSSASSPSPPAPTPLPSQVVISVVICGPFACSPPSPAPAPKPPVTNGRG
jgi:hypothetical protein